MVEAPKLGTWEESKLYLAQELNRMAGSLGDLVEEIQAMREDQAKQSGARQAAAAMAGAIWGGLVAVGVGIITFFLGVWAHRR